MTMDTMIGIDLAKNVFQVHGASMTGQVFDVSDPGTY